MIAATWIFLIIMFSLFGAEQLNRYRLWRAIENEDLAYIDNYARRGKDLNVRHLISRETPLLYAIVVSKKEAYRRLLDLGADPNFGFRRGPTIVHMSAHEKDPYWLDLALRAGGDPNLKDPRRGSYPIAYAIFGGGFDNVKLLAQYGADLNSVDRHGRTPLTLAASAAEFEVLYYLLENGADYLKVTQPGYMFFNTFRDKTPEFYEKRKAEWGAWCRKAREWLRERGADPDKHSMNDVIAGMVRMGAPSP
jgi:uncharacterized protein